MSELVPRKKTVPVQAHRLVPETVHLPGGEAVRPPPAAPGVTQNIYINVSQPAPVAPPPTVVEEAPPLSWSKRPKRLGKGTSFLGMLGFVLGAAAAGMAYLPPTLPLAKDVAMTGAALAGLGLLGAVLFNRVGRGMPIFGLMASAVGFYLWLSRSGQMPQQLRDLQKQITEKITAPAAAAPPTTPATPSVQPTNSAQQVPPIQPPAPDNGLLHDNTIFGDRNGGWSKTNSPTTQSVAPAVNAPSPAMPPKLSTPAAPVIDVATAKANLQTARIAAAKRLNLDYTGAQTACTDAETDYQQAKIADAPGSADLIAASQLRLQADSQLKILLAKLDADPAVAAAEAALKTAQAAK